MPEIDALLAEYGHAPVSPADTLHFLSASETQTVTGILPLFNSLALEWFLIGMEKQLASSENAALVYVLDRPSHALESPEHTHFLSELQSTRADDSPVGKDMIASACAHRRKLIGEALRRGNQVRSYLCTSCLERYLSQWRRHGDPATAERHKVFLREHLRTMITLIDTYPESFRLHLLRKCPQLRYELLYLPDDEGRVAPRKLMFLGRESGCARDAHVAAGNVAAVFAQGFGDLIGFATDLQSMLDFFEAQHTGLHEHFVDARFGRPEAMVRELEEMMKRCVPAPGG